MKNIAIVFLIIGGILLLGVLYVAVNALIGLQVAIEGKIMVVFFALLILSPIIGRIWHVISDAKKQ
jgi:hypothetical protein